MDGLSEGSRRKPKSDVKMFELQETKKKEDRNLGSSACWAHRLTASNVCSTPPAWPWGLHSLTSLPLLSESGPSVRRVGLPNPQPQLA